MTGKIHTISIPSFLTPEDFAAICDDIRKTNGRKLNIVYVDRDPNYRPTKNEDLQIRAAQKQGETYIPLTNDGIPKTAFDRDKLQKVLASHIDSFSHESGLSFVCKTDKRSRELYQTAGYADPRKMEDSLAVISALADVRNKAIAGEDVILVSRTDLPTCLQIGQALERRFPELKGEVQHIHPSRDGSFDMQPTVEEVRRRLEPVYSINDSNYLYPYIFSRPGRGMREEEAIGFDVMKIEPNHRTSGVEFTDKPNYSNPIQIREAQMPSGNLTWRSVFGPAYRAMLQDHYQDEETASSKEDCYTVVWTFDKRGTKSLPSMYVSGLVKSAGPNYMMVHTTIPSTKEGLSHFNFEKEGAKVAAAIEKMIVKNGGEQRPVRIVVAGADEALLTSKGESNSKLDDRVNLSQSERDLRIRARFNDNIEETYEEMLTLQDIEDFMSNVFKASMNSKCFSDTVGPEPAAQEDPEQAEDEGISIQMLDDDDEAALAEEPQQELEPETRPEEAFSVNDVVKYVNVAGETGVALGAGLAAQEQGKKVTAFFAPKKAMHLSVEAEQKAIATTGENGETVIQGTHKEYRPDGTIISGDVAAGYFLNQFNLGRTHSTAESLNQIAENNLRLMQERDERRIAGELNGIPDKYIIAMMDGRDYAKQGVWIDRKAIYDLATACEDKSITSIEDLYDAICTSTYPDGNLIVPKEVSSALNVDILSSWVETSDKLTEHNTKNGWYPVTVTSPLYGENRKAILKAADQFNQNPRQYATDVLKRDDISDADLEQMRKDLLNFEVESKVPVFWMKGNDENLMLEGYTVIPDVDENGKMNLGSVLMTASDNRNLPFHTHLDKIPEESRKYYFDDTRMCTEQMLNILKVTNLLNYRHAIKNASDIINNLSTTANRVLDRKEIKKGLNGLDPDENVMYLQSLADYNDAKENLRQCRLAYDNERRHPENISKKRAESMRKTLALYDDILSKTDRLFNRLEAVSVSVSESEGGRIGDAAQNMESINEVKASIADINTALDILGGNLKDVSDEKMSTCRSIIRETGHKLENLYRGEYATGKTPEEIVAEMQQLREQSREQREAIADMISTLNEVRSRNYLEAVVNKFDDIDKLVKSRDELREKARPLAKSVALNDNTLNLITAIYDGIDKEYSYIINSNGEKRGSEEHNADRLTALRTLMNDCNILLSGDDLTEQRKTIREAGSLLESLLKGDVFPKEMDSVDVLMRASNRKVDMAAEREELMNFFSMRCADERTTLTDYHARLEVLQKEIDEAREQPTPNTLALAALESGIKEAEAELEEKESDLKYRMEVMNTTRLEAAFLENIASFKAELGAYSNKVKDLFTDEYSFNLEDKIELDNELQDLVTRYMATIYPAVSKISQWHPELADAKPMLMPEINEENKKQYFDGCIFDARFGQITDSLSTLIRRAVIMHNPSPEEQEKAASIFTTELQTKVLEPLKQLTEQLDGNTYGKEITSLLESIQKLTSGHDGENVIFEKSEIVTALLALHAKLVVSVDWAPVNHEAQVDMVIDAGGTLKCSSNPAFSEEADVSKLLHSPYQDPIMETREPSDNTKERQQQIFHSLADFGNAYANQTKALEALAEEQKKQQQQEYDNVVKRQNRRAKGSKVSKNSGEIISAAFNNVEALDYWGAIANLGLAFLGRLLRREQSLQPENLYVKDFSFSIIRSPFDPMGTTEPDIITCPKNADAKALLRMLRKEYKDKPFILVPGGDAQVYYNARRDGLTIDSNGVISGTPRIHSEGVERVLREPTLINGLFNSEKGTVTYSKTDYVNPSHAAVFKELKKQVMEVRNEWYESIGLSSQYADMRIADALYPVITDDKIEMRYGDEVVLSIGMNDSGLLEIRNSSPLIFDSLDYVLPWQNIVPFNGRLNLTIPQNEKDAVYENKGIIDEIVLGISTRLNDTPLNGIGLTTDNEEEKKAQRAMYSNLRNSNGRPFNIEETNYQIANRIVAEHTYNAKRYKDLGEYEEDSQKSIFLDSHEHLDTPEAENRRRMVLTGHVLHHVGLYTKAASQYNHYHQLRDSNIVEAIEGQVKAIVDNLNTHEQRDVAIHYECRTLADLLEKKPRSIQQIQQALVSMTDRTALFAEELYEKKYTYETKETRKDENGKDVVVKVTKTRSFPDDEDKTKYAEKLHRLSLVNHAIPRDQKAIDEALADILLPLSMAKSLSKEDRTLLETLRMHNEVKVQLEPLFQQMREFTNLTDKLRFSSSIMKDEQQKAAYLQSLVGDENAMRDYRICERQSPDDPLTLTYNGVPVTLDANADICEAQAYLFAKEAMMYYRNHPEIKDSPNRYAYFKEVCDILVKGDYSDLMMDADYGIVFKHNGKFYSLDVPPEAVSIDMLLDETRIKECAKEIEEKRSRLAPGEVKTPAGVSLTTEEALMLIHHYKEFVERQGLDEHQNMRARANEISGQKVPKQNILQSPLEETLRDGSVRTYDIRIARTDDNAFVLVNNDGYPISRTFSSFDGLDGVIDATMENITAAEAKIEDGLLTVYDEDGHFNYISMESAQLTLPNFVIDSLSGDENTELIKAGTPDEHERTIVSVKDESTSEVRYNVLDWIQGTFLFDRNYKDVKILTGGAYAVQYPEQRSYSGRNWDVIDENGRSLIRDFMKDKKIACREAYPMESVGDYCFYPVKFVNYESKPNRTEMYYINANNPKEIIGQAEHNDKILGLNNGPRIRMTPGS